MSGKKPKATRKRMISCFAQIVQEHIPGWKIEEIVDVSKIYAAELSRVRGITPANLNTFSNANRSTGKRRGACSSSCERRAA